MLKQPLIKRLMRLCSEISEQRGNDTKLFNALRAVHIEL